MIDYSEKRDFIRMSMQCPIAIRNAAGGADEMAELLDLSASGVRFKSARELYTGDHLQMTVQPPSPITPPLQAAVSVEIEPAIYPADD